MKALKFNSRKLYFSSFDEVETSIQFLTREKYAILITANSQELIGKSLTLLKSFLTEDCSEIYIVGKYSERVHDLIDEIIEDLGSFSVLTTWASATETYDDISHYFIRLAGTKAPILFAFIHNDSGLEKYIENFVLRE